MTNHYELADVIEIGRAQDLILGNKQIEFVDNITQLFGTRVIDSLDETE